MAKNKGFTLIELMVVVAIIGLLAAIAIPGLRGYLSEAKKADGVEKLKTIADLALSYYNLEHSYDKSGIYKSKYYYPGCEKDTDSVLRPKNCSFGETVSCSNPAIGQKTNFDDSKVIWRRMGMQIASPTGADPADGLVTYYCYDYESRATDTHETSFTARAYASLENTCDSQYKVSGDANGKISTMVEVDKSTDNFCGGG